MITLTHTYRNMQTNRSNTIHEITIQFSKTKIQVKIKENV